MAEAQGRAIHQIDNWFIWPQAISEEEEADREEQEWDKEPLEEYERVEEWGRR